MIRGKKVVIYEEKKKRRREGSRTSLKSAIWRGGSDGK